MNNNTLYTISAVATMIGVPAHTIRYWEKEFSAFLSPLRPNGGHRRYGSDELAVIMRIKSMLKDEKYSIAGARQKLQNQFVVRERDVSAVGEDRMTQQEQAVVAV